MRSSTYFAASIAFTMGCASIISYVNTASDIAFFTQELRSSHTTIHVPCAQGTLSIREGRVSTTTAWSLTQERTCLARAYAVYAVTNNPTLGIEGTDPDAFLVQIHRLSDITQRLASLQDSTYDATNITTALYPIKFLTQMAQLELDRKAFLASSTNEHLELYMDQLATTALNGQHATENFSKTFMSYATNTKMKFGSVGGSMSVNQNKDALTHTSAAFRKLVADSAQEKSCFLRGSSKSCSRRESTADSAKRTHPNALTSAPLTHVARDAIALSNATMGKQSDDSGSIFVALANSTCLATLPGPYIIRAKTKLPFTKDSPDFLIHYVGDLLFIYTPAIHKGAMMAHLRDSLHITYALINPFTFYVCPDVSNDMGGIFALVTTLKFAREHTSILPEFRSKLLQYGKIPTLELGSSYVETAFENQHANSPLLSSTDTQELQRLRLMFQERSGGYEFLLRAINDTLELDLQRKMEGLPFDLSARSLVLTHHAFPTLLFLQHPSLLIHMNNYKTVSWASLKSSNPALVVFSELHSSIPRPLLIHDLNIFRSVEER